MSAPSTSIPSLRIAAMDLATSIESHKKFGAQKRRYDRFVSMRSALIDLAESVSSDNIRIEIENAADDSNFDDYLEFLLDRVQEFRVNPIKVNAILDRILIVSQMA